MPFKRRSTDDTERLSGRVTKGLFRRFREGISPREKVVDHLSAALSVWAGLRPEIKTSIMTALERDPKADPVLELLNCFGLNAAKVVKDAESRYEARRLPPAAKTGQAG
jgi:hypothetical protein